MNPSFLFSKLSRTRLFSLVFVLLSMWLVGCGSGGQIVDPFKPTRVIVFGDAFSVISTTTTNAYTVNDGSTNNWASQIAAGYGVTNIVAKAAGNASVANVLAQINAFGANYQSGDLVIVSAGFRDLLDEAQNANNTANASKYGNAYAELIRTLVANGAKHVVATNVYDLAKTPAASIVTTLAQQTNSRNLLVQAFNDALKINLGDTAKNYIGDSVRLVDLEGYLNLVNARPNSYAFTDASTVACGTAGSANTANDVGNGIGIGTNQVNSSLCTPSTLNAAATSTAYNTLVYNNYVFADSVYPTPAFHRLWGSSVYSQLIARW